MNPPVWTFRTIDEDRFIERFGPQPNHFEPNSGFDLGQGSCLFASTGEEYRYVLAQDRRTVWTLVEGDEGQMTIESGMHFVNRLGYIMTAKPVEDHVTYSVTLDF